MARSPTCSKLREPGRFRWKRWLGAIAVLVGLVLWVTGCTSTIQPPLTPRDPVSVWLVIEARHRGLILPRETGDLVEYAYGEWQWFAHNRDAWHDVPRAALWPTRGTLGRRLPDVEPNRGVPRELPGREFVELRVCRTHLDQVRQKLEQQFYQRQDEAHHNPRYGFTFVPHESAFWLGHNCTDAVAEWLRDLGCEVSRTPLRLDCRPGEAL